MTRPEHPLDNPVWSSLTSMHRAHARGAGGLLRFQPDVAPFLATRDGDDVDHAALDELVARGETVYTLGPRPVQPRGWQLEDFGPILQMIYPRAPAAADPDIVAVDDRAAILELAALVYPHYFRRRTPELGRYFGILDGSTLAAMVGERMGMAGHREISAVCTRPGHTGRGLARRLLLFLAGDIAMRGDVPFLHVSPENERAVRLYEQNGFQTRTRIAFAALRRPEP